MSPRAMIERALDAGLLDLVHAAIAALDAAEDADLEEEDTEPDCDADDDGRGHLALYGQNYDSCRSDLSELLYVRSHCPCCGALTETEEMVIA